MKYIIVWMVITLKFIPCAPPKEPNTCGKKRYVETNTKEFTDRKEAFDFLSAKRKQEMLFGLNDHLGVTNVKIDSVRVDY